MKSKDPINQTNRLIASTHEKKQLKSETESVVENQSKRRLLRNIAVTTPVVLAVSSKPALAVDCTGSIMLSGNLSNHNCTPVVTLTEPVTPDINININININIKICVKNNTKTNTKNYTKTNIFWEKTKAIILESRIYLDSSSL